MNKKPVYAFIDSQNLYMGIQSEGWTLDYAKFRLYLKNKYKVEKAFIFIGKIEKNNDLYDSLKKNGYALVFKPTVRYFDGDKETSKGNVDAELVLHSAAIQYGNYSKALIISGDGDFACLVEYLDKHNKLLGIMVPNEHFSGLLRRFNKYIIRIDLMKNNLEYRGKRPTKKTEIGVRSKP
jgi:uncharacterized LabA/DUF88 family protein